MFALLKIKTYLYANGQILAQYDGDDEDDKYFTLHDRLGSVRLIIDTSGNVKNRYTYNPFGEKFSAETEENVTNNFLFTGQCYDSEIGQYYLRARMYDPAVMRFTARDPVFGELQQPLTLHKYLYCGNDPMNRIDLSGDWAVLIGGSLSGNVSPGLLFSALVKDFGLLGYAFGISAFAEMGLGGTAGGGFVFAHDPDKGATKGWSTGWLKWVAGGVSISSGSGYSLTLDVGFSPEAKRVSELHGHFEEIGGSVTFGVPYWLGGVFWNANVSFTASRSVDEYGNPTGVNLYTGSVGTGLPGWEVHGYRGYAWAHESWSN